jgi:sulfite exporter TauE/SafE
MVEMSAEQLTGLRAQVRAAQHARSMPLMVIGVLLLNYGITAFEPHPMAWRYGAPLAFVLLWALAKVIETNTGVGTGRFDYLIAAGFVFTAVNALLLRPFNKWFNLFQLEGLWVVIIGVALAVLATTTRDRMLRLVALVMVVVGAVVAVGTYDSGVAGFYRGGSLPLPNAWPNELISCLGIALAVAGFAAYTRERKQL